MNRYFRLITFFVVLLIVGFFHSTPIEAKEESDPISIYIDLWAKKLYLMQNQSILKTYPVAGGSITSPSPLGDFKVINKHTEWGGGFGSRWMGLNVPWGLYGIHGTNAPWSIGTYASGGCIRMYNNDVKELFERITIGTPVHIDGPLIGLDEDYFLRLARDSRGNLVQLVQNRLQAMGVYHGRCHGIYDLYTEIAVREFQRKMNLPVTGYITFRDYLKLGIIE